MTTDPDYEFPPRKATPKTGWTIWSIKNRWLRAAVAWMVALAGVVIVATIEIKGPSILEMKEAA